ncbi:MAG: fatty acid CoA ligase family protein [Planctomycetota bacterium]
MPTETASPSTASARVNVADRLAIHAAERPDATAVVAHDGRMRKDGQSIRRRMAAGANAMFSSASFAYLNAEADALARGLVAMGVRPGHRLALLVKPGVEFVALVFALLRSGATMVLVDGGLGRKNIIRCLQSTQPDGFVAIPQGHALRVVKRKHFANAKLNVTVGRRWFWGGETLDSLRRLGEPPASAGGVIAACPPGADATGSPANESEIRNPQSEIAPTGADDPAAIVFTSGSTGPPKGVVYRHETFVTQCDEIQRRYDLRPGAVDLACFPLFGLFNVACGVTTVLPRMDFSRPASCDPKQLFAAARQWECTQSFASPAVWDRLSRHAEATGETIPTLKKVFSCGAPVPARVIRRTLKMVHPDAELHTPFGATEALPVATIEAREILDETAAKTDEGAGVCVGRKFDSIDWRIVKITDDPIATIDQAEELPAGEIGELIVRGPQVSRAYLDASTDENDGDATSPFVDAPELPEWIQQVATRVLKATAHNERAKIEDGNLVWHRMGDVGYFDERDRFWYCGRKSQRGTYGSQVYFADQVEAYFNSVEGVRRTAMVSVATRFDYEPVIVFESEGEGKHSPALRERLLERTRESNGRWVISEFIEHPDIPTDIRHNSKIRREELAVWAAKQLRNANRR